MTQIIPARVLHYQNGGTLNGSCGITLGRSLFTNFDTKKRQMFTAAETVESMCFWVLNYEGCAETQTHEDFHFGFPCPYAAMAAVLRGEPDPRLNNQSM